MIKITAILGLMVVIVSKSIVATEDINTSKGFVKKLCETNCQQSTDEPLLSHCERGCRFFHLAQTANTLDLNSTASMSVCVDSCKEAYTDLTNQGVCISGCWKAQEEVRSLQQMNHLVEEAKQQMSFLSLIITSSFWSPSGEESDELPEDHEAMVPIYFFKDGLSQINKLDKNPSNDVEIITLVGEDMTSADSSGNTLCTAKIWFHRLSFILIIMGALTLLLVSSFYIASIIKHKRMNNMERTSGNLSKPPSYETLIKDGYIVMSKDSDASAPANEKDEKLFIA